MNYLTLALCLALASSKVIMQSSISKMEIKSQSDALVYNLLMLGITGALFSIFSWKGGVSKSTLLCGAAYGVSTAAFQVLYTKALSSGPISLSVMIVSFGNMLSVLYGVAFCGEKLLVHNIVGLILIISAVVLNADFSSVNKSRISLKWLLTALAGMAANGLVVITAKVQKQLCPGEDAEMMRIAYITGSLVLAMVFFFSRKTRESVTLIPLRARFIIKVILVGTILFFYSRVFMLCLGRLPVSIVSPVMNIGTTVLVALFGILHFKDSLNLCQKISLCLGIPAVLLMVL